jgi:hypothetical protein
MNKILSAVTNTLKEKGFDLIKPFQVKWFVKLSDTHVYNYILFI